ncbi:unnamed protein product [Echinostoma caproni]|uniref:SpoU_methylase domain-containing protein n=1 Tax=Echinostoma caproni TaxID=27848 RepID=A0A183AY95_9TREM|nr:unnamed protein product [Echinostoma caproni]
MPNCMRLASWIALSNLIAHCVFDGTSARPIPTQLKDFTFWRLVVGHSDLLASELKTHSSPLRSVHIAEIISSLKQILTLSQSHTDPDRDTLMETALHHTMVAHLVASAVDTFQHSDPMSPQCITIRQQISEGLMLLVGLDAQTRFQQAICELPSFPRSGCLSDGLIPEAFHEQLDAYLAPFQNELEIVCSCQRAQLTQLIVDTTILELVDPLTHEAGLLCLASLQRLVFSGQNVHSVHQQANVDRTHHEQLDPQTVRICQSLIHLAQSAARCTSPEALVSAQVLYNTFQRCGLVTSTYLSAVAKNDDLVCDTSLHCVLWPYLTLINKKCDSAPTDQDHNSAHQRIASMRSDDQLIAEWNQLLSDCVSQSDEGIALSKLILWWMNLPVVLSPICSYLRPALEKSVKLCYNIFPWLFVTAVTARDVTKSHCSFSLPRALTRCIQNGMLNERVSPTTHHLFLDSLMALHYWSQWNTLQRSKNTASAEIPVNWLQAAQCAISLRRLHDARLCFELAWLHGGCPSNWLSDTIEAQEVWLGLCRLSGDLPGLQAAQMEFLLPDKAATGQTVRPLSMLDEAK